MDPQPEGTSGVRLRLFAITSILLSIIWSIAPGKVQPDTKLNLITEPWGYLRRSLFAWNDQAGLGELQNQAYGYLFPMGPVFGMSDLLGLPDWASQRVWWSILVLVGFFGAHRLAMRIGGFSSDFAIAVALFYVISPRLLSVLAEISIEAWPASLAPWLVLAAAGLLGDSSSRRHRVRSAALTTLLVVSLGGVNATASLAVLLLPFLWLLCAPAAARRWRALGYWFGAVVLGAAWWLIPLVVLGNYGYPFLDYIETSRITTAVTSLPNTLRGADHWIAYILDAAGHPVWQAGWVQAQYVVAILVSCFLAGAGIFGLIRLRQDGGAQHRVRFLFVSLLLGLALISLGYGGVVSSPFAEGIRSFLDGVGSPFRNVHKFDPLVRLPLAWGFGYCLVWLTTKRQRWSRPAVAIVCLVAVISPTALWVGRAGDARAVTAIPQYWYDTAEYVDQRAADTQGSTLVLPNARTADMTWGKVTDEPLTVLASSPVAIRAAAPLGHPGGTRLLDEIDNAVGTGLRYEQLASVLARMGVSRVVVRDDISPAVRIQDPDAVRKTLASSPGFEFAQSFGDHVSVWTVDSSLSSEARLYPMRNLRTVNGVPNSLVSLLETGMISDASPTLTEPSQRAPDLQTDSFRWAMWNSGLLPAWGTSELLDSRHRGPDTIGSRPLPPLAAASEHVTRMWRGSDLVLASSSAADPFGSLSLGSGYGVAAAVDGNGSTSWWSDLETVSWFSLGFDKPTDLGEVTVDLVAPATFRLPEKLTVEGKTGGQSDVTLTSRIAADGTATFDLSGIRVDTMTITFPDNKAKTLRAISEVRSSKVDLGRSANIPQSIDFDDSALQLIAESIGTGTIDVGRTAVRRESDDAFGQRWMLDLANANNLALSLNAKAANTSAAEYLLDGARVESEQRLSASLVNRPGAAFDADPDTQWLVPPGYAEAIVTINWDEEQPLTAIETTTGLDDVRARVGGRVTRLAETGGKLNSTTDTLELVFTRPNGVSDDEPWSVPETIIHGAPVAPKRIVSECGVASVSLDKRELFFKVDTTRDDIIHSGTFALTPCFTGTVDAPEGAVDLTLHVADWLHWTSLTLQQAASSLTEVASEGVATILVDRLNASESRVRVSADTDSILVLPHGFNKGWVAETPDGKQLVSSMVDGWQQAFIVPEGTDGFVTVRFAPQTAHTVGLLMGPLAVVFAIAVLCFTRRPRKSSLAEKCESPDNPDPLFGFGLNNALVLGVVLSVGFVFADWVGLVFALVIALVPRMWLPWVAAGSIGLAGIIMSVLGVVDRASYGTILGQVLGLITVLGLVRWWFVSAPNSELVSPRQTTRVKQAPK